jgi:hypothetical protein
MDEWIDGWKMDGGWTGWRIDQELVENRLIGGGQRVDRG